VTVVAFCGYCYWKLELLSVPFYPSEEFPETFLGVRDR